MQFNIRIPAGAFRQFPPDTRREQTGKIPPGWECAMGQDARKVFVAFIAEARDVWLEARLDQLLSDPVCKSLVEGSQPKQIDYE
jgi:hypothetical protein